MKLGIFFIVLLPCVLSVTFGTDSVVITGNDVPLTGLPLTSLKDGELYRVYAVYAQSAKNKVYADSVHIVGTDKNLVLTVAGLSVGTSVAGGYFLSNENILQAPITITDPKLATADFPRTPYTIYIVSTRFPATPVISAQYFNGFVDSVEAKLTSTSCTVLSAEPAFQLSDFDTGSMGNAAVKPTGYDAKAIDFHGTPLDSVYSVLIVTAGSFVVINGPIATLYNSDGQSANFKFALNSAGDKNWKTSLPHRARVSFLSNGWLNQVRSYNVEYPATQLQIKYDYGSDTEVDYQSFVARDLAPGDTIQFSCILNNGVATKQNCSIGCADTEVWCRWVEVVITAATSQGPQYMIKVKSGAATSSMFVLAVAVLARRLFE